MATLRQLCDAEELVEIAGGLDDDEQIHGLLFGFPHVVDWLERILPELSPELGDGRQSPLEQVDDLFHDFSGEADLGFYQRSHSMTPSRHGVWELKTPDVRFFGWYHKRRCFVIANADTAFRCKQHQLYDGYLGDTIRRRGLLELDEPKFLVGDYDDVL